MRNILPEIEKWRRECKKIAVATVVKVWGSAPRPLGSKMAISSDGDMVGSVSGGCVEGAVFEEAQAILASGEPKLVHYGVTHDQAWAVGLSCGGQIEIFIEPLAGDVHRELQSCLEQDQLVAVATRVAGSGLGRRALIRPGELGVGSLGSAELDAWAREQAGEAFRSLASRRGRLEAEHGEVDVFIEVHAPRPVLIVVGAVHAAVHLVRFAHELGFRTVVVDPRTAFATPERFAHADELVTEWPGEAFAHLPLHEATYVALLSHDLKLDIPALEIVLRKPVRYIGALGSRKTHAKRIHELAERGLSERETACIHSPIGLDLGGRRAEEIALSVISEVVAVSHGKGLKMGVLGD